jgi:hypothetical protein
MGGTDDLSNLVELSIEDHAEEHNKLWKKYGKNEDYLAYKCLSAQITNQEFYYERAKLGGYSLKGKKKPEGFGKKISETLKGKPLTEETKKKISQALIGRKVSQETKNKISKTCKEKGIKPPTGFGINNSFFGKKHTEETKQKISLSKTKIINIK